MLFLFSACQPGGAPPSETGGGAAPSSAGSSSAVSQAESGDSSSVASQAEGDGSNSSAASQAESGGEADPFDPFGVYDPAIKVTSMMLEENLRGAPEGMTLADNPWVEKYREYGMEVDYKLTGTTQEDLTTKLNMAIASGGLPDVIWANPQQFQEMAEDGYLTDLSEVFEQYATDETKEMYMQDGGLMLQNGYVGGKLYGLPRPQGYRDYIGIVSIRADWMRELGLEAPETLGDVWSIAQAFKDNNMEGTCDIGIGLTKQVVEQLTPSVGLLNAYGAHAEIWLEKDGKLEFSSIQPEMKEALAKLNEYYRQGLIDPEFGTKETANQIEDALSGRSGVVVSHFCAPFDLMNGVKVGQEWAYYRVPLEDGSVTKAQVKVGLQGALCYSAEGANPEAMIKMLNLFVKLLKEDPAHYSDDAIINFAYPAIASLNDLNYRIHSEYMEFLETGVQPAEVTQGYDSTVEAAEKWRESKDIDGYTMWAVFGPESTELQVLYHAERDGYMIDKFTGAPTPAMELYNSTLKTMTVQMITDIICGTKPIDSFDEYVEAWKANGGSEVTDEINAWYAALG
jgi:putative aldouronate transport system substrate-binding protein